MTFQFDFKMIGHYGFNRYRKAKLLAKAIKKLNRLTEWSDPHEPDLPDERMQRDLRAQYWLKIAEKLSADPNVPTEYVSIRMMIKSLFHGYVNLVLNLYGQPELVPTKEMQKRIEDLFLDLLLFHRGRPGALDVIEKAHHLIDVIKALYIVRFAKFEDPSGRLAEEYLGFQSLNNKFWSKYNPKFVALVIEDVVKIQFDLSYSVKQKLSNLMSLIPVQNIGIRYETGSVPLINVKSVLIKKYPFDYLEDKDTPGGVVDLRGILGLDQDFTYSQSVKSPIITKRPLKLRQIKHVYEKVLELKTQGVDPNVVAIKLQIAGIYLRSDDILEIYHVISDECPEPDVLYTRSTKNLKLLTKYSEDVESSTPRSIASSKNDCNSQESGSVKSELDDYNQDISLESKRGAKFNNHSLNTEPRSDCDNDLNGNKISIKIDPMHGYGQVIYCSSVSHKDEHASSVLGANNDISEEDL
ncbi:hypothetical protein [Candidatus Phycorickettsia trachydisci]|nr:hypothetical protein [Candidatus Phycorickettsia trachydisci]